MPSRGTTVEVHHVFLSSPGDMERERDEVRQFFTSFNRSIAPLFGIRFEVIDWENCTDIGFDNPQDLITEQTLARFKKSLALVIGLMGQRFGTATGRFESGTQAEFEWAARYKEKHGHPEIKWFFRRTDDFVAPAKNVRELRNAVEQWKKVQRFRKEYKGLYKEFGGSETFPQVLREDLFRWFSAWIIPRRTSLRTARNTTVMSEQIPDFLNNRLSRTFHIVTALEELLHDPSAHTRTCLRICAVMSSLAITPDRAWVGPEDEEYLQLLQRERDLIEELFDKGVSLKILLTWNIKEMLEWQERTRDDVFRRLSRLRTFCEHIAADKGKLGRAQLVHIGVRERNLFIIGDQCVFEGRKLNTKPGFEATQLITAQKRVQQEIQMFDILLASAIEIERAHSPTTQAAGLNQYLIEELMARIDRDMKNLESPQTLTT